MGIKKVIAATLTSGMMLSFIPAAVNADSSGWKHDSHGWQYYIEGYGYVRDDWKQVDGKWYFFYENGYMIYDVDNYCINGIYYAFDKSGACLNPDEPYKKLYGFHEFDYVVNSPWGDLAYTSGTLYYEPDGQIAKGWRNIEGDWYYFREKDGKMMSGKDSGYAAIEVNGTYYYFTREGVMITGWYKEGNKWFYADSNGSLYVEKWLCSGGDWYYFNSLGHMVNYTENYMIDGIEYDFDMDGVCLNPYQSSVQHNSGWYRLSNSEWCYYNEDGSLYTGWLSKSGHWYYLDPDDGLMATGYTSIDGKEYYFSDSGEMVTGWINDHSGWSYAGADGVLLCDQWINDNGNWYYIDFKASCVTDCQNYEINGIDYDFDSNGVCLNPYATYTPVYGWHKRTEHGHEIWNYYGDDGYPYRNEWLCNAGYWYYFDANCIMLHDETNYMIDGKYYDFRSNGICINPYNGR